MADYKETRALRFKYRSLLIGVVASGAVLAIVIGLAVGLTIQRCNESKEEVVRVGLLFPTDDESAEAMKEAAMLAVDDIRAHRNKVPSAADIQVHSGDYDGSPDGALQAFRRLYNRQGVRLFVGPDTSSHAVHVTEWAAANAPDAVFISPRATSERLANATNTIRLSMSDQALALALYLKLQSDKVSVVIPVHIEDSYSTDIVQRIRDLADGMMDDITVGASISYAPGTITNKEEARRLTEQLRDALRDNPDAVVLLVSYSEAKYILEAASGDSTLLKRMWYTGDSLALREDILSSDDAKQSAQTVSLYGLAYAGEGLHSKRRMRKMQELASRLKRSPPVFAPLAYDAVNLFYDTCQITRTTDAQMVLAHLTREAEWQNGLSGRLAIDSKRGRAFGDYLHSFVAPQIPDTSKVTVAMTGSWILDGLSQVSHMDDESRQGGGRRRREVSSSNMMSMSAVMSPAMSSASIFNKSDVMALKALAGNNCRNPKFSITATDPATYMQVEHDFTEDTFPEMFIVSTAYGYSLQMNCDKPEGPVVLDVLCPPSTNPRDHMACVQTLTYPVTDQGARRRLLVSTGFIGAIGECIGESAGCAVCFGTRVLFESSILDSAAACLEPCVSGIGGACGNAIGEGIGAAVDATIICTELFVQGHLDAQTYLADAAFGRLLAAESPHVMDGYHTLASPIVWLMQRSETATSIVKTFALPWAQHMSYLQDMADEGDELGAVVMEIGMALSGAVGRVTQATRAVMGLGDVILIPVLIAMVTVVACLAMRKNEMK
ncbi:Hypp5554 [Branchiostoma lanceolatum]|uniref:Hypp5554 protein n=1 Tax=Branchiostoma lanceolatum TaxID=7740 RepID=A0A8J9YQF0_BRALA|nr:Hypp5554 [Branchiostoma lanceolatum]